MIQWVLSMVPQRRCFATDMIGFSGIREVLVTFPTFSCAVRRIYGVFTGTWRGYSQRPTWSRTQS